MSGGRGQAAAGLSSAPPQTEQSPSTWPAPPPAADTTLEQPTAESSFYLRHFLSAIHLIWLAGDPHDTAVNQQPGQHIAAWAGGGRGAAQHQTRHSSLLTGDTAPDHQ